MEIIGVIGSGAMGSGIAQIAATAGHDVMIYDVNEAARIKSRDKLLAILNRLAAKGRLTDSDAKAIFSRIYFVDTLEQLEACGTVIEAIIENLDIKKKVFSQLEAICGKDTLLATNTSSLSVASIAAACKNPERVIGIHFFNPAPVMKLVEIIPAIQTSQETKEKAFQLINNWGKMTALAKDTPGFIVNRVARPFYGESLRIHEEGIASPATIDWVMKEIGGFRMGPFELMDYIGHDVNYKVTETVWKAFYYDPRYKPSFAQKVLVDAGYLGRKSGKGFYEYGESSTAPEPVKDMVAGKKIFDRIIVMLINEAADALFWKIASYEDIESAMKNGVNYPKGLLEWGKELSYTHCVTLLDDLQSYYKEDRYRCSPWLRNQITQQA